MSESALAERPSVRDRLNAKPGLRSAAWVEMTLHVCRMANLFSGNWVGVLFPRKIQINNEGIRTQRLRSILCFWQREEELVAFRRVFGIKHLKGLFWDSILITSAGDINTLEVHGLSKKDAQMLVRTIQKKI